MQINNYFRYTITDRIGGTIAQPLGESDFTIEWERDDDAGKRQYKKTFGGNIIFVNDAYQRLLKLEKSIYRCELQDIQIDRGCKDAAGHLVWKKWFDGKISLNDGEWDLDGCKVSIKFSEFKPESCFEDNKSETVNLFSEVFSRYNVLMFPANVTIEYKSCDITEPVDDHGNGYYWCGDGTPGDGQWVMYYDREENLDGIHFRRQTKWARQRLEIGCDELPPAEDWVLVEDNCGATGKRVYARPVTVYACEYNYGQSNNPTTQYYMYETSCKVFGQSGSTTEFRNGMKLEDVLNAFVSMFCPEITVKSDFFQFNPDNVSTINYVTGKQSKVLDLMLFAKSDVKRPNASGQASRAEWTFEKLMTTLNYMFNVQWRIENGVFRIEHVSYFTKSMGLDLTQQRYAPYMKGMRKYSYKNDEIPKQEVWKWKEASAYGDFVGQPITYDDGCVTAEGKDNIKIYQVEDVMTEVEWALANPTSDSSVVSDDGFVMMATAYDGTSYYILTEAAIYGEARLNNTLAFAQLMRDYQKYERPLREGYLNGERTVFISVKPTKKGETVTVPLCCDDTFNPDDLVKTELGLGTVDKATFNFKGKTLGLDLLYEANTGLTDNTPPVVTNKTGTTYQDESIIINVLAGATDVNNDIDHVIIDTEAMHGTVLIMDDNKIKYTPNPDYVGDDMFIFNAVDSWGEKSNNGLVQITVYAANQPPVANDDFYNAFMNQQLEIAAPGVFLNDSDDISFKLASYQQGAQGGVVVIDEDGALHYTPPEDFEGEDTFEYTIYDDKEQTATATVHINITDATRPVAEPDFYQTTKDMQLTVSAPGTNDKPTVLENDTTPAPGTYTYSTTEETGKATEKGGTVDIDSTGGFVYTPPAGFTGTDTFEYEVSNGVGTATGLVTIQVLPVLYVKLSQISDGAEYPTIICDGLHHPGGRQFFSNVQLNFYADAAKTIPLDVTGLNLQLYIREGTKFEQTGEYQYNSYLIRGAEGTQWVWLDHEQTHEEVFDCSGTTVHYYDTVYNLESTDGYTVL